MQVQNRYIRFVDLDVQGGTNRASIVCRYQNQLGITVVSKAVNAQLVVLLALVVRDCEEDACGLLWLSSLITLVPMRATDVWLKGPGYPGYPGKNSLLVPDHAKAVQAMAAGLPCVILVREWHPRVFTDRESVRQLDSLSLDTVRWRR
eukprot:4977332-Amphidinium_carterae.1